MVPQILFLPAECLRRLLSDRWVGFCRECAAANTLDSKASLAYIEKAAANDGQYSILMQL
jgi:predicted ATP-dependent serine protease